MSLFIGDESEASAVLSGDGTYRYELTRRWGPEKLITWVMLNPSTADAETDDPTIRRCIGFSKRWFAGGIRVVNLYGYRATNPTVLSTLYSLMILEGPGNREYLKAAVLSDESMHTMVAWGGDPIRGRRRLQCS